MTFLPAQRSSEPEGQSQSPLFSVKEALLLTSFTAVRSLETQHASLSTTIKEVNDKLAKLHQETAQLQDNLYNLLAEENQCLQTIDQAKTTVQRVVATTTSKDM